MKSFLGLTLVGMPRCGIRGQRSALSLPMLLLFFSATLCFAANPVLIGSKKFTESYVLGEIAKRTLHEAGIPAEHRQGMGGTIILWEALRAGKSTSIRNIRERSRKKFSRPSGNCRSRKFEMR